MVRSEPTSLSIDRRTEREGIAGELSSLVKELEVSQGRGNLIIFVVNEPYLRDLAVDFISNRFELKKVTITKGDQISRVKKDKEIDVCLWQLPERVGPDILNALNFRRELFYETDFPNVVVCNKGVLDTIMREAPDFWRYKASYHILDGVRPVTQSTNLQLPIFYKTKEEIARQLKISDYLLERTTNNNQRAFLFFERANLLQMLGSYKKALTYYSESLKISKENSDSEGMASVYLGLGIINGIRGDYEKALSYYEKSLEIAEEIGDKRGTGIILGGIGIIHNNRGDYEEALSYYEKSLEIAEEIGNRGGIASALGEMSRVFSERKEFKQAVKLNLIASTIFNYLKSPLIEIITLNLEGIKEILGEKEFNVLTEKVTPEVEAYLGEHELLGNEDLLSTP